MMTFAAKLSRRHAFIFIGVHGGREKKKREAGSGTSRSESFECYGYEKC